jgi:ectoine hydroxylase-related dioxygenase (phytanoyl-CoA dioxygenase family)
MSVQNQRRQLNQDGFCVLPNIIPADQVGAICQDIVNIQQTHNANAEAELAKTRARGHRVGAQGVSNLRQIINHTQSFVPYLAAPAVMTLIETLFGLYPRISCTDCVINHSGNERNYWHADWPYNQTNASHIPAPYPDALLHLSSIWMLTPFSAKNGGTLIVPGSHRQAENPSTGKLDWMDYEAPYPTEVHVTGAAGSVLFYDSRLWHAVAPNQSDQDRVALIIRYAPWWLNLNPSIIGRPEHTMMVAETGGKNYEAPPMPRQIYEALPDAVKPLYRHSVL